MIGVILRSDSKAKKEKENLGGKKDGNQDNYKADTCAMQP